jgi:PhnB protein
MVMSAKPIPEGHHTVTPYIAVKDASKAIEFYKQPFGAVEKGRMTGPNGKGIMHAEIKIGDSFIFLSDEIPDMGSRSPESLGGNTGSLHLYVEDADAAFRKAVSAGAQVRMPVTDMFWGDRYGKVIDPFGHEWGIGTHTEDLTEEQVKQRAKAAIAGMAKRQNA